MRRFFLLSLTVLTALFVSAAHRVNVQSPSGGIVQANMPEANNGETVELTVIPSDGYQIKDIFFIDTDGENVSISLTESGVHTYEFTMPDHEITVVPSFIIKPVLLASGDLKDGTLSFSWYRPFEGATFELYVLQADPLLTHGVPSGTPLVQTADTFYTCSFPEDMLIAYVYIRTCLNASEKGEWQRLPLPATLGKVFHITMADTYGDGWNEGTITAVYPDGTERRLCLDDYNQKGIDILLPWAETVNFILSSEGSFPKEMSFLFACPFDEQGYTHTDFSDVPEGNIFYTYMTRVAAPTAIYSYTLNTTPDTTYLNWEAPGATSWNAVFSKEPVNRELLDTLVLHRSDDAEWQSAHGVELLHVTQNSDTMFAGAADTHYYVYLQSVYDNTKAHGNWANYEFKSGGRVPTEADIVELNLEAHFAEFNMEDVFLSAPGSFISKTKGYPYRIFKYTPTQDTSLVPYAENLDSDLTKGTCLWYCTLDDEAWDTDKYDSGYQFDLTGGKTYYFLFCNAIRYGSFDYGMRVINSEAPVDNPLVISYQQSGSLTIDNTKADFFDGFGYAMTQYMGSYTPEQDMRIIYTKTSSSSFYCLFNKDGVNVAYLDDGDDLSMEAGKKYDFYISADGPVDYELALTRAYENDTLPPLDTLRIDTMEYTPVYDAKDEMYCAGKFGLTPFLYAFEYAFRLPVDSTISVAAYHPNLDTIYARIYKEDALITELRLTSEYSFIGKVSSKLAAGDYHVCFLCKSELLPENEKLQVKVQYQSGHPKAELIQPLALNEIKSGAYYDLNRDIRSSYLTNTYRITLSDTTHVRLQQNTYNNDMVYAFVYKDSLCTQIVGILGWKYTLELADTTYFVVILPTDKPQYDSWSFSLVAADFYHLRPYSKNIPIGKIFADTISANEKELININSSTPLLPANDYNVQMEKDKTYRITMSFSTANELHFYHPWSNEESSIVNIALLTSGELQGGYDMFNGDDLAYYDQYFLGDAKSGKWSWLFTSPETGNVRMYVQPWLTSGTMPYTLFIEEMKIEAKNDTLTLRQLLEQTTDKIELPHQEVGAFIATSTFVAGESGVFNSSGSFYHASAFRTPLNIGEEMTVLMQGDMSPYVEIYRIDASNTIHRLTSGSTAVIDHFAGTYMQTITADANADYYIVASTEYKENIGSWVISIAKGNPDANLDVYDYDPGTPIELSLSQTSLKLHGSKKGSAANELAKLSIKGGELDLVNDAAYWTIDGNKATLHYPAEMLPMGYCFKDDINIAEVQLTFYWNVTFLDANGNEIETQQVNDGGDAVAPSNPTKTGYAFKGWDSDITNVTSDLTVKPNFSLKTYVVIIKAEHGSVSVKDDMGNPVDLTEVPWGTVLKLTATPDEGYEFQEWKGYNPSTGLEVTEDVTVEAIFVKKSQGIDEVSSDQVQSTKIIRNGQLLIQHNGKTYTVMGVEAN